MNKTQVEGTPLGAVTLGAGPDALLVVDGSSLGPELWRTDGTPAGTKLVKDIRPGADGSAPADFLRL